MASSVILTVMGSDRPGLTQAIADAVLASGGNWLESHLARLGGSYVGAVLVDIPEDRLPALEAAARRIDAEGLSVKLVGAGEAPAVDGRPLLLELVGQDRPGIVREVTAELARLNVNIEDFASGTEHGAWSGAPLFRVKARVLVPGGTSVDAVREALERLSGEIMVDIGVSDPAPAHEASRTWDG